MKKLLLLLLTLAMVCSLLAGCEYVDPTNPDSAVSKAVESVKGFFGGLIPGGDEPIEDPSQDTPPPHEHNFVLVKTVQPSCSRVGRECYECECGEEKEVEFGEPIGHDMKLSRVTETTCEQWGSTVYKCSRCGTKQEERYEPLGHVYAEEVETSRIIPCTRPGCSHGRMPVGNGKYKDVLVFSFDEEDEQYINDIYNEIKTALDNAAKYDATLHAFSEDGEVAEAYAVIIEQYNEFYRVVINAQTQMQLAQIRYYGAMNNAEYAAAHAYMMEYYSGLVSTFYTLDQPFYDSMFREYFYYGMTEEEIQEHLADSNSIADAEYAELTARNAAIEAEFDAIRASAGTHPDVPTLYFEFVQNNKRIAEIMGYENYLAYAYENVYRRDYSYTDAASIASYVKTYIAPVYNSIYGKYVSMMNDPNISMDAYTEYMNISSGSFFSNVKANHLLNDYIDLLAFDTNPDKTFSFSDEFNKLVGDGNLFRGNYAGAYVTTLNAHELPIMYIGGGYDDIFTVAHEFGHYMNELYNADAPGQSYDLLEMHSQANEMLLLYYLDGKISDEAYDILQTLQLLNMLFASVTPLTVDSFEQAVYTDTYTGKEANTIMADGTITADEYDLLYQSILADYGITQYNDSTYWRSVVISSPCYYISYSVSALSVLQIYQNAYTSVEDATESYLKLFTYTDVDPYMTTEEILVNAGLLSFTDERLYSGLSIFLREKVLQ